MVEEEQHKVLTLFQEEQEVLVVVVLLDLDKFLQVLLTQLELLEQPTLEAVEVLLVQL